jgi:hypothetical protein
MINYKKFNIELTKEQEEQQEKGELINYYETPTFKEYEKNTNENINDISIEPEIIDYCIEKLKKYETKKGETLKIVNIDKINNLWKKDKDKYISENYEEIKYPNKYLNSRKDLIDKKIEIPPKIMYDEKNELILFENGRHRFSNLRDLGCKEIPVIVTDKKTIKKINEL